MKNNNELVKKFTKDVNKLENKIEHPKLYNIRNFIISMLIKSGIAIDYALPFILAAIIWYHSRAINGSTPFILDEVTKKANVKITDTSSGIHLEHISYDYDYDDELIEHSTGWVVNDKGLYERVVTSYRLNDEIDLNNTEKIISMTKEEIEKILVITNVRKIQKNFLTPEDSIYNEDAIIVINNIESETESIKCLEAKSENTIETIFYIITVFGFGTFYKGALDKIIIKKVSNKLKECESAYRQISRKELETMRKILILKKENLALINGEFDKNDQYKKRSYKLRKR